MTLWLGRVAKSPPSEMQKSLASCQVMSSSVESVDTAYSIPPNLIQTNVALQFAKQKQKNKAKET